MGTFNITSSKTTSNYTFTDEYLKVDGSFLKDAVTGNLENLNGRCNEAGDQGAYVGNFQGYMRNGEMVYNLSEVSRRNMGKVWDAIDEIESHILPQAQE